MLQGHPIKKLHRNESAPVFFSDVVNRANVGMVQGRSRLRLSLETGKRLGIVGNAIGQKLQRYEPVQPRVVDLVNQTHTTTADLLQDVVVGDGGIDHVALSSEGCLMLRAKGNASQCRLLVSAGRCKRWPFGRVCFHWTDGS